MKPKQLVILIGTLLLSVPAFSQSEEKTPIIISSEMPNRPIVNRAPMLSLVSGFIDTTLNLAVIDFTCNIGEVTIRFEHLESGYTLQEIIVGTGTVLIPFACAEGLWSITITLENESTIVGQFEIE